MRENDSGTAPRGYMKTELPYDEKKKQRLIKLYKTQTIGLFDGQDIPSYKEIFFISKDRKSL
jgi:hypothetical protein